jgi:lipopolysaccharide export system protein LptA
MALVLADRVKETSTTTGTGTITLAGASTGFQSFSVIGNGNTCYYTITNQTVPSEWEVGIGTYTLAGTTLARTTILASSNAGAVVTLSAGTKDVFVTYPAGKAVYEDASDNVIIPGSFTAPVNISSNGLTVNSATVSVNYSIPAGSNALSAGPITINAGIVVTVPSGSVWVVV